MIKSIIYNVDVVTPSGVSHAYVCIDSQGLISSVTPGNPPAALLSMIDNHIDGHGNLLMPGAIDCHVHFREPGLTRKATIATESRAAIAGGVTSFVDMPNTVPQTVSMRHIEDKLTIAAATSAANYGFFIGATNDNIDELIHVDYKRVAGVKLFMGSSTGNMLVDSDSALERLFAEVPALISVHAEDEAIINRNRKQIEAEYPDGDAPVSLHTRLRPAEACFAASERAVNLARRYGTRLHLAHLTTAAEIALLDAPCNIDHKRITAEVSPHHLWWISDDYARCGSRIKMNPSVKSPADRIALRKAVIDKRIDVIATDHAPHLLADKAGSLFKAASGAPMVQFSLPAMLEIFEPKLVATTMAYNPAHLLNIDRRGLIAPGYYADLALVEHVSTGYKVSDADVLSLCHWTPMAGQTLHYRVKQTWVNGYLVYDHGSFCRALHAKRLEYRR